MRYYLAYGSNLNVEQMRYRCPGAVKIGASKIRDWKLAFRRSYLTIEPERGKTVPVGIWKINDANEKSLDRYEGYPRFYVKMSFTVTTGAGMDTHRHTGIAYIMSDGYPLELPSDAYLRTCLDGYMDFGLDPAPLLEAVEETKDLLARNAVEAFAAVQNGLLYCPRCGRRTMKSRLTTNARSRHTDIYVCDACGTDEGIRDFAGNPLPLRDWDMGRRAIETHRN